MGPLHLLHSFVTVYCICTLKEEMLESKLLNEHSRKKGFPVSLTKNDLPIAYFEPPSTNKCIFIYYFFSFFLLTLEGVTSPMEPKTLKKEMHFLFR